MCEAGVFRGSRPLEDQRAQVMLGQQQALSSMYGLRGNGITEAHPNKVNMANLCENKLYE